MAVVVEVVTRRRRQPVYLVAAEAGALRVQKLSLRRLIWLRRKPGLLARPALRVLLLVMAGKAAILLSAQAQSKSLDTVEAAAVAGKRVLSLAAAEALGCLVQEAVQSTMLALLRRLVRRVQMAARLGQRLPPQRHKRIWAAAAVVAVERVRLSLAARQSLAAAAAVLGGLKQACQLISAALLAASRVWLKLMPRLLARPLAPALMAPPDLMEGEAIWALPAVGLLAAHHLR